MVEAPGASIDWPAWGTSLDWPAWGASDGSTSEVSNSSSEFDRSYQSFEPAGMSIL
jgi:hypothetical protein